MVSNLTNDSRYSRPNYSNVEKQYEKKIPNRYLEPAAGYVSNGAPIMSAKQYPQVTEQVGGPSTPTKMSFMKQKANYKEVDPSLAFRGSFQKMSEDRKRISARKNQYSPDQLPVRSNDTMDRVLKTKGSSEKPICILKVSLDDNIVEQIKVYKYQNPADVVNAFADKFSLSKQA